MKLMLSLILLSIQLLPAEKFDLEKIKKSIETKGEEFRGLLTHKLDGNKLFLVNESSENKGLGIGFLTVYLVDSNNEILSTAKVEIEMKVRDHWLVDLDKDGNKEIVFVSYSIGSGHYANLFVYTVKGSKLIKRKMPSHIIAGYGGHEKIEVKKGNLYLSYPLYNENDSNANPTGGELELKFDAKKKLWKDRQGTYLKK